MEENTFSDKRKFNRANVNALVVIRCDVVVGIDHKDEHKFYTHTESISEGGISIILDEELHSTEPVKVRLYLTGKVAPIECKGKVAWSRIISPEGIEPNLFLTGVEFVDLDSDGREHIRNIVSCFFNENN